jgi:hypothetical protein
MIRSLPCLLALLLSACQPADPAPAACDQVQADAPIYLMGQLVGLEPGAGDSVYCLNAGWETPWTDIRSDFEPHERRTWFTGARLRLYLGRQWGPDLPGADQETELGLNFVFAPSSVPGTSYPSDLQVGRVPWGNARMPGVDDQIPPPRPGVQVWFRRNAKLDQGWYSYAGEQAPDHYLEITDLRPDPDNDQRLIVSGRFTARLYGFADASGRRPSLLLRGVRFRLNILPPAPAYTRVQ